MEEIRHICLNCMGNKGENPVCPECGHSGEFAVAEPVHLKPGTVLNGKFLIGRVLGHGGFGITYLGWDLMLEIKLAIKEYFPQDLVSRTTDYEHVSVYTGDARNHFEYGLQKFMEEARVLAKFDDHPGIVSVREYFRENQTAYMVMNYVEGMTLQQYVSQKGNVLPWKTALGLMMPVLDALHEIHEAGILHREISPDNIYITKEGRAKLLDFGAARTASLDKQKSLSVLLRPGYAPEEQYRTRGVQGPWTDIYAAAGTIYRLITGEIPLEAMERLLEDILEKPSERGVDLPETVETALMKALAIRSADRYQTVKDFQKDLKVELSAVHYEVIDEDRIIFVDPSSELDADMHYGSVQPEIDENPHEEENEQQEDLIDTPVVAGAETETIILDEPIQLHEVKRKRPSWFIPLAVGAVLLITLSAIIVTGFTVKTYQWGGGTYTGETSYWKPHGQGTFTWPNGDKYVGAWIGGEKAGQGTYTWGPGSEWTGDKYVGEWKDDLTNGQGTYTWENGDKYVGEWKDDLTNGQGTFAWANGNIYVGGFRNDLMNGQGTFTWANGDKYVGGFRNDLMNGQGNFTWANGDKYVGEWKDDLTNGQGTFAWANGNIYVGGFRNDLMNGQGTYTWENGDKYVGQFRDDAPNGMGTYTWSDGAKYVGEFKDWDFHGQGKEYFPNGSLNVEGRWVNGEYVGN